ncbi:hypothetical protein [Lysinibacillus sphaericus]|uniref:hypothetical protein n=1 Tax=Lysinibacillus TaxID=400634 RepID=UPI0007776270|nr:hypothetical protein [Lysinibacillus sphaericus]MBE5086173.1 hypothetical protein [Bacillus thuringiensis]AMO35323.1 hypothetical protein AR327_22800 [Lysinibacillus sphaericus]AMR93074.1 hypothetical protein A1T07_22985 [Lysinibacillus sphaericus]MDR0161938.1 hypothetical protein [Lysinibacillus sphaericus]QPA52515.1 hypothetical protein INQ54_23740 [Lysinibacillus sphaericus]
MSVVYRGLISPLYEEPVYFSERGIPLLSQYFEDVNENELMKPLLTMENYEKWYSMYIIYPDGKVEKFSSSTKENCDTWYDHAVYPSYFHLIAKRLGCTYDNRTFALVCERFVEDVLDGDWTALHNYLPKER